MSPMETSTSQQKQPAGVEQSERIAQLLDAEPQTGRLAKYRHWIYGSLLLLAIAALAGLALRARGNGAAEHYRTETVTRGNLNVTVSATGNLQPRNKVDVGSEQSGMIAVVLVQENDRVKQGQPLARLDQAKLTDQVTKSQATLASAQAKLAQTEATVKEATASLERLRQVSRLSGGKVPSTAEMDTAEATLARAQADRLSAAASVNEARATLSSDVTNLSKATLRSPINGVVLTRSAEPGQTVAAGLQVTTLFTIAEDLREMELKVYVDEADAGTVRDGQNATFTVDAYPGRKYKAKVLRVAYGSQTKDNVVSYPTVLRIKNDDLTLRPGMTATAEIATSERNNVLQVPNAALRFAPHTTAAAQPNRGLLAKLLPGPPPDAPRSTAAAGKGGAQQVWVLREHQPPVAVPVIAGLSNGRWTEVTSIELKEGMQVVTEALGTQK